MWAQGMGLNKLTLRSSKTYRHSSEWERAAALTGGILKEHISEKSLKEYVSSLFKIFVIVLCTHVPHKRAFSSPKPLETRMPHTEWLKVLCKTLRAWHPRESGTMSEEQ